MGRPLVTTKAIAILVRQKGSSCLLPPKAKGSPGVSFLQCRSLLLADIVAKVGEGRLGRNNRIGRSKSLNQPCVSRADLEPMLLPRTPKIFLQQNRPEAEMGRR